MTAGARLGRNAQAVEREGATAEVDDLGIEYDDDLGIEYDEPEGDAMIPASMRETGSQRLVLPEITMSPDSTTTAEESPVIERDVEPVAQPPRSVSDRLRAHVRALTGERPEQGAWPSIGGVELPSPHSIRAALGDQRPRDLSGRLSTLFPTASTEQPIVGPDLRSQAGVRNAADALTFGFTDELNDVRHGEGAGDRYARATDIASEQAPESAVLGQAAGSIPFMALPGGQSTVARRIGVAGLQGAGMGALRGAGEAEEGERIEGALEGAATEGALSAGTAGLAEGGTAAIGAIGRRAQAAVPGLRDRLNDALLESRGVWGRTAREAARDRPGGVQRLVGELDEARYPRDARRSPEVTDRILEREGPRIGRLVEEMDEASALSPPSYRDDGLQVPGRRGRVDVRRIMERLEEMARTEERAPIGGRQRAEALRSFSQDLAPQAREGMGFGAGHQQRRTIDDMISRFSPDPNLSTVAGQRQQLRRLFSDELGTAAEQLGRRGEWDEANSAYSLGSFMDEHGRGAERLNVQGGIGGATQRALGAAQMMAGDPRGALGMLAGPAVQQEARMRIPGMQARVLERIIPRLEQMGPRARQWAQQLANARGRGQPAVAAQHFLLSRQNPEYRALVERLSGRDGNDDNQDFEPQLQRRSVE